MARWMTRVVLLAASLGGAACNDIIGLDPADPARGPGQLVGNGDPVSGSDFGGGADPRPPPRSIEPPAEGVAIDCNGECLTYCAGLELDNPVNVGLCTSTWGVGLDVRPIEREEACRRLYADFVGRYPSHAEIDSVCAAADWGDTVRQLQATPEYLLVQQRRWADKLLYNNRAVNFERAYDMDELVGKAYRGLVSWDEFAAVVSAHPILVRRYDTGSDRVAFLFKLFLGRPPYENERADLARLYRLWFNGYWEHPHVGRVPDSFIDFECIDDAGRPDPQTVGECTSILFGHHELTLAPDRQRIEREGDGDAAQEGMLWSGFLLPDEWKALQLPGRIVAASPTFWEYAVDEALEQLLGYNLAIDAPSVRHELVRYILAYNGDIRALHFAIATSFVYLQSSRGETATTRRFTYGPLKQIQVEGWIDSIRDATGYVISQCDHRLPYPEDYVGDQAEEEGMGGWAHALVDRSRWEIDAARQVEVDYRNLARTLGGCPTNEAGGRFTTVSVLNTAVQEAFVAEVCGLSNARGIEVERLLPAGISANTELTEATADAILTHQHRLLLGRAPTDDERAQAQASAATCSPAPCTAQSFARPLCFVLASSSEMLFY